MLKADAITFGFGQQNKACQCRRSETGKCLAALGILVPEGRAMRLQEASGGELQYLNAKFMTNIVRRSGRGG